MSKYVGIATEELKTAILKSITKAQEKGTLPKGEAPAFTLEIPADHSHGNWASNAAMVSARTFHMAPRKIAEAIKENISLSVHDGLFFLIVFK